MPTIKKLNDPTAAKLELMDAIDAGNLTVGQSVRAMRRISGMNQKEFSQKLIGISTRVLAEIERDEANPTAESLNKIGRVFGYKIGFVRRSPR
jgi:putative transcriptional regulator